MKYEFNSDIGYLEVDPKHIKAGINFAKKNEFDSIRIYPLNQNAGETYDLVEESLYNNDFIKRLVISDDFKIGKINIDFIYSLKNLEHFEFDSPKIKLDCSKLTQLKSLFFKDNQKVQHLDMLINLESLYILNFKSDDCKDLEKMKNLNLLRFTGGSFKSLNGIETLKVEDLRIDYQNKLEDVLVINELTNLKRLDIEKCKSITDLSFLKNNNSITRILISEVDSIQFIGSMINLEEINFWNCNDGDLAPLITSKRLRNVNFYPNKKHYSHTLEEIVQLRS